ncbi:MAG TPA: hypothetical protein VNZ66_05990 [Aeromicrobium sp.]|nr:hypothetical protein [Aeromicrobium sp.]
MSESEQSVAAESLSVDQLRRLALLQDALLFCCAFTGGALVYGIVRGLASVLGERTDDFWTIGLSDDLVFAGLVAAEVFLLWNNGLRQGLRGHSIGKHREGLAVVGVGSGRPVGTARGLLRGLVVVVLLDLSIAAIPIGLPTVLRRATPDSWHIGLAAYAALVVLVIPLLLAMDRRLADIVAGTTVVETGARTSRRRGQVVSGLEVLGVVGVLGLAVAYIVFFSPLIRFPDLF